MRHLWRHPADVGPARFRLRRIYYWYPRERQVFLDADPGLRPSSIPAATWTLRDTDYFEVYGKVTWEIVKDRFAVGANVFYSDSWLNTDASGTCSPRRPPR